MVADKTQVMLATLVDEPFDGEGWFFETKWDGYRMLASKKALLSRGGQSFTGRFPLIAEELKSLPGHFLLDGEAVVLDSQGRSQFQLLQNNEGKAYYYVFDILFLNGKDLRPLPLFKRKEILTVLLKKAALPHIRLSEHRETYGKKFFKEALKKGLEGIIAKKADSPYQAKRTRNWLKIKTTLRQEMVIGGFTKPKGHRSHLGALLVGVYDKGQLTFAGRVGGGFNRALLKSVYEALKPLVTTRCPFKDPPDGEATWVKPKLVVEVAFAEWTGEGKLRQPIFKGLRVDKAVKDVIRERPHRYGKS